MRARTVRPGSERLLDVVLRPWASSLGDVEAEGLIGGEAFGVHAVEDRNADVDIVVELDVVLAVTLTEEPSDVLHDSPLEGEGEGQEQGVERGPVEALAEVGAGGDQHDALLAVFGLAV